MAEFSSEVDEFFSGLRRELGLEEDDGEFEVDVDELDLPDPTPPSPAEDEPPSRAVPEVVPVDIDEDDTYPGSRHVRRGVQEVEEEEEAPVWDTDPRFYRVKGTDREFFPISALATALRRKPGTLRKWEDRGYLPQARYRAPVSPKTDSRYQTRLYTRPQIEGLIAIATEEGLMEPAKKMRIDQTRFPQRAQKLFAALEKRS